jgi:hypothetical protein
MTTLSTPNTAKGASALGRWPLVAALALLALASSAADLYPAAPVSDTVASLKRNTARNGSTVAAVSSSARRVADWAAETGDHGGRSFFVIDKPHARLHMFDVTGKRIASTPVLLGAAIGDDTVEGIGLKSLGDVRHEERTTPAGRFIGERGHNASGSDVVWIDYDSALSMHRVINTNPAERRLERMASPWPGDHRISWGCVNVPTAFYDAHIRPEFARGRAVIYLLPDVKTLEQAFGWPEPASALSAQSNDPLMKGLP